MLRTLRRIITRWRFKRAFAAYLNKVAEARARHGHVNLARADLQQALHRALAHGREARA